MKTKEINLKKFIVILSIILAVVMVVLIIVGNIADKRNRDELINDIKLVIGYLFIYQKNILRMKCSWILSYLK